MYGRGGTGKGGWGGGKGGWGYGGGKGGRELRTSAKEQNVPAAAFVFVTTAVIA